LHIELAEHCAPHTLDWQVQVSAWSVASFSVFSPVGCCASQRSKQALGLSPDTAAGGGVSAADPCASSPAPFGFGFPDASALCESLFVVLGSGSAELQATTQKNSVTIDNLCMPILQT
jgi:hypothetical protein